MLVYLVTATDTKNKPRLPWPIVSIGNEHCTVAQLLNCVFADTKNEQ